MADDPTLIERFRRARADPALAVLEGFHPLKHALRFGATIELACAPRAEPLAALAERLAPDLGPWLERHLALVAPEDFRKLAPAPPATGVLAIARRPAVDPAGLLATPGAAPSCSWKARAIPATSAPRSAWPRRPTPQRS